MTQNSYFVIEGSQHIASISIPKEATTSGSAPQIADYAAFSRVLESRTEIKEYVNIDGESKRLGYYLTSWPLTL
jgi:hypothetical protein